MPLKIRAEREAEYAEIYDLVKTAFETAKVSDGDEQDYLNKLREDKERYIPDLALVAELCGALVGQVILTKTYVAAESGKEESLLLGPVAVLLGFRERGIGAALINEALARAKNLGFRAVFLCGDPAYYGRFGFKSVSDYDITYDMDIPAQYVLVCELQPDWLKRIKGKIAIM